MLVLNGESSSWLSDVWRQHSQEWLCHKDLRRANAAGLWSCPTPPCRPSSPTSLYKSPHRCPPVGRLLPPPSRQNNPAQPPRVLFLFQVTPRHSSLPCEAPAQDSFRLSQTSPARAYSVQTSCKSRPSPSRISLQLCAPFAPSPGCAQ